MNDFQVHTAESAPEGSRQAIVQAEKAFGLVPNLIGVFAESPAVVKGYMALAAALQSGSFTALEREIVLIGASVENECHYCVAAHTTVTQFQGLDQAAIAAVRAGGPIADPRLEALRRFTTLVVRQRGFVADVDVAEFLKAGFTRAQVLEVVLGVGLKTISNYTNHLAETPLDAPFQANAFTPLARAA